MARVPKIPELDALRRFIGTIGGTHSIEIEVSQKQADKISGFEASLSEGGHGRPLLDLNTKAAQSQMRSGFDQALQSFGIEKAMRDPQALLNRAVQTGVRWVIQGRLRNAGNDIPWRPLSPAYRDRKAKRGQSTAPGIATGELLRAIERAKVTAVKQ